MFCFKVQNGSERGRTPQAGNKEKGRQEAPNAIHATPCHAIVPCYRRPRAKARELAAHENENPLSTAMHYWNYDHDKYLLSRKPVPSIRAGRAWEAGAAWRER